MPSSSYERTGQVKVKSHSRCLLKQLNLNRWLMNVLSWDKPLSLESETLELCPGHRKYGPIWLQFED